MVSAVYVWPLYLLGGLSADLQGGNGNNDGLKIASNQIEEHGVLYTQFSLSFEVESEFSSNGRVPLLVSGQRSMSVGQAARSAVIAMFEALQVNYDIYSADYSYVALSEKRALYNAMKQSLDLFCSKFARIEEIVKQCHSSIISLSVTVIVVSSHPGAVLSDEISVSGFQAWVAETGAAMANEIEQSGLLLKLLIDRDPVPDDQCHLDVTAPMPMRIDWEVSYFVLSTVFREAVCKMNCRTSGIQIISSDDGQFKASIQVSVEPFLFVGGISETALGAKAKLMYAVIKHINVVLGYPIMDLHHSIRQYQDTFIRYFDFKMHGIWRSG